MGNSIASQVEEKFGLLEDVDMQLRVNSIGQKIVKVCDRQNIAYSFRVLKGEELEEEHRHNAFALPGGYVYIFKEMVLDTENDDELAAILAHEVGHIVARHSVKKLQSSIGLGGLGLVGALSKTDRQTKRKTSLAISQLMMEYSREAEFEADKLSVRYLDAAGFDPKAAVHFVDRMLDKQLSGKIHHYHYFRTHPYTTERRAAMNKEIDGTVAFDDYINTPLGRGESYW
jgi:predicted Zn-dependent protease